MAADLMIFINYCSLLGGKLAPAILLIHLQVLQPLAFQIISQNPGIVAVDKE